MIPCQVPLINNEAPQVLPAAGATPYDIIQTSRPRVHDLVPMVVRIQEEYLKPVLNILQKIQFRLLLKKHNRKMSNNLLN